MSASVSTHVLDTGRGEPAPGVRVELYRGEDFIAAAETDADGRIADLARELEPDSYRLVFHPPSEFFSRVAFDLRLEDGHYHVPLLVAPYGCTSYRGS